MQSNEKKKSGTNRIFIVIFLVLLVCFGAIVYPLFSTWYSEQNQSEIRTHYEELIAENDTENLDAIRQAAVEWNEKLYRGEIDLSDVEGAGYLNQLKVDGTSMIARVRIPCINVDLPVYHTDNESALSIGAGHLEQTSLPIGGPNTHAVISAHSGMAAAEMFSNLERMTVGDIFYIDVLGETLTYQVRSIDVVLPTEISAVAIEQNMDLVTLLTCTPYGVNTHRLLVTGSRIETPVTTDSDGNVVADIEDDVEPDTGNVWMEHYVMALFAGVVFAVLFVIVCIIVSVIRKKRYKARQKQIKWSVTKYTD